MRGLLWFFVGVLFAYAAFELVRGYRLRIRRPLADDVSSSHAPVAAPSLFETGGNDPARREMVRQIYATVGRSGQEGALAEEGDQAPSIAEPGGLTQQALGAGSEPSFQSELEARQLRHEVARLEGLVASQRAELTAMGEELRMVKSQLETAAAPRAMSPEYSEALVFARRGLDAEAIAERCGISQAEAELVLALARKGADKQEREA